MVSLLAEEAAETFFQAAVAFPFVPPAKYVVGAVIKVEFAPPGIVRYGI